MRAILLGILGATSLAAATPVKRASLDPSDPTHELPLPTRPLEWGDVNVIHTTDIHGWISGHQKNVYPEKSWSGNFGYLFSFVARMEGIAHQRGSDILFVDTGDRRIGHGLTDHILDPLEGVNGQNASSLYYGLGYDLVVPGNHDLQNANVVKWTKEKLVDMWKDRYLTSNIDRTDETDPENRRALGAHYRRWETREGRRMLAFGVVTSKTTLPKNSGLEIIPINKMIERKWFKDAIKRNAELPVDVFVLLGHVDPKKPRKEDDIELIYKAIRQEHPLTPILILTGHTHQRWCRTFQGKDGSTRSMLLQSGRYFDTVGWMSVELDNNTVSRDLKFSRRYLDNNVPTFMYHSNYKNETEFHTGWGHSINKAIYKMEKSEALSKVYGHLDSDYYLDRKVWTEKEEDKNSLFSFYLDAVQTSLIDTKRSPHWLFFSNWGIVRGDIYRGPFTLSDFYAISPDASDTSPFLYLTVQRRIADQIVKLTQRVDKARGDLTKLPKARAETHEVVQDNSQVHFSSPSARSAATTYGWVTKDECGNGGDDIDHVEIPQVDFSKFDLPVYFWRKNYKTEDLGEDDLVDIVVTNRIGKNWVPKALEHLGVGIKPKLNPYREDIKQNNLLPTYIHAKFP